jgi:hypothetical protein
MNIAAIISTYEECERTARARVPGGFLLFEVPKQCVMMAADENGVTYDQARDIMLAHWIMEAN